MSSVSSRKHDLTGLDWTGLDRTQCFPQAGPQRHSGRGVIELFDQVQTGKLITHTVGPRRRRVPGSQRVVNVARWNQFVSPDTSRLRAVIYLATTTTATSELKASHQFSEFASREVQYLSGRPKLERASIRADRRPLS